MKLLGLLFLCIAFCNGARILGIFNHPGASHTFLGKVLLKTLVQKGHQVVMISSFPMENSIPNYKDIALPELLEDLKQRDKMYFHKDKGSELDELRNMTMQHTEATFINPQVKELLQSNESFDLIIIDWFFNEATLIFGHIYNAPVIFMSSFGNMALLNDFSGNSLPFSYVPGAAIFMSDEMSFKHRTIMTLFNILNSIFTTRRNAAHYEILKRHFDNPPTIEELKENVALILSNSHFSFETPRPYTPNIIPIGGFHIGELEQLPQDLKTFLDASKEGVIYFSLGSQIKISNLNKTIFSDIVKAFGKIQQKVLWKYEDDDLSDIPKNIKLVKWAPQVEVLAHPNVKLFITHAGTLSFIETMYFSTPVICLPFNGDQQTNAAFIESRYLGLHILYDDLTERLFRNMIEEVISNSTYQTQMNFHSSLLREQPIKPLDAAVYWVEHAIKFKHGNHLKTFATKLPWYKYYLIDVLGLFVCIAYAFIKILHFILKKIAYGVYFLFGKVKKSKTE